SRTPFAVMNPVLWGDLSIQLSCAVAPIAEASAAKSHKSVEGGVFIGAAPWTLISQHGSHHIPQSFQSPVVSGWASWGCSENSGTVLTKPDTFTMRITLSSEPNSCAMAEGNMMPVWRTYA